MEERVVTLKLNQQQLELIDHTIAKGVALYAGWTTIVTAGSNVDMAFNVALQDHDAYSSGLNSNLTEAGTGTLHVTLTPKPIA